MGKRRSYYDSHDVSIRPKHKNTKLRKIMNAVLQWVVLVFIAAILGYAVVTFGFQTVTVVGPSMENTLSDGQVVVVNKFIYRFQDVKRYDIIAFNKRDTDGYYSIKRVVGLPGETIKIVGQDVFIDGNRLSDLPFSDNIQLAGVAGEEMKLGKDEYFVLGDNVNNSEDSRYTNIGNVSKTEITGKVVYRLTPKNARGKIKE